VAADSSEKGYLLVMKGAPERILDRCNKVLNNGRVERMDDIWRNKFNETYLKLGGLGERVLGISLFGYFN